jgi:hypothetical protein
MRFAPSFSLHVAFLTSLATAFVAQADTGEVLIISGDVPNTPNYVDFVNYTVNADIFYNAGYFGANATIANVEAGHIWGEHEVFDRTGFGLPAVPSVMLSADIDPAEAPQLGDYDYHATMVGHVLAGTGDVGGGSLSYVGMGMAPFADLWSGAIATSFSTETIGAFSISTESFLFPYVGFFTGSEAGQPDVINSSWGFTGDGDSFYTLVIDALASSYSTVTSVVSAGNAGPDPGTVGEPASGHNSIVVGALEAVAFEGQNIGPTDFSSRGPVNFFNPVTNTIIEDARVGVHVAAPGENMALAAYLGDSGALTGHELVSDTPATDLYFTYSMSGTSFASPTVAGGVALLKDVAKGGFYLVDEPQALDSRVMRSVIMAGAVETPGWDNGLTMIEDILYTTQSLDFITGAGALDLTQSAEIYLLNTTNVEGLGGGTVSSKGWDFGAVDLNAYNDYVFDFLIDPSSELTIALNWFVNGEFDIELQDLAATTASFADLNLEVWRLEQGIFTDLIATSASLYNNTEFLRIPLGAGGEFGFRVVFDQIIYDATGSLSQENYAIAWTILPIMIPEPSTILLLLVAAALVIAPFRFPKNNNKGTGYPVTKG